MTLRPTTPRSLGLILRAWWWRRPCRTGLRRAAMLRILADL